MELEYSTDSCNPRNRSRRCLISFASCAPELAAGELKGKFNKTVGKLEMKAIFVHSKFLIESAMIATRSACFLLFCSINLMFLSRSSSNCF